MLVLVGANVVMGKLHMKFVLLHFNLLQISWT